MDRPYRPNKYVLRAPPPIPPRPGGGSVPVPNSATIERAPPLPPRPPTVTENRAPLRQAQTDPPPYDYPCQPTNYQERDGPVELEASIPPGPIAKPAQHSPPPSTAQSHSWASFQTQFFPPPPRRSTSQLLPQPPPPPPSYPSPTSTAINPAPAERLHDGHTPSQSLPYQNAPSAPLLYHEQKQDTALPPTQTSPSPPRKNFQDKIQSPYASSPLQNNQRRPAPTTISTPRPRIEFNPPHKYILRKCPATAYHLVTPGTWYFHSSVPEFKICTYCYEKHISPTQFSSSFQKWTSPAGGKPFCFFSVPRIKDLLWPRAIQTGDVGDVLDFFGYRLSLSLRQCPGEGKGVKASEGAKWFQLNQRHQGRFPQDEFTQSAQPQGRDVLFACDVAVLFIGKLVLKSDLDTFITKASRHLELPECAKGGTIIDARSRRWYQPRTSGAGFKADDLSICERCYNDFMVHTLFKDNFQLINITSYSNTQRRCLHGLYHSRSVWSEAVESKDFNIWVNAMSKFIKYPPCTLQITPGTSIYQIPGVDNFDICHSCFVGIIEPFGRKWYGETGCRICQSCYEEVCRDTYLATFFQSTPETPPPTRDGEDGIHCDMYSPRMRSKWQEACITQNLDFFLQFASYRKSVYDRTVPEMRFLLRQAKLNLAMQKMHNTTSTFYNAMDGATAWQFNPHIRYTGGGVGGSFATPYGVTGAQEGQAAWGLMTSTSSMTSRVGQLEGLWHAVE
ncbi:hypothetical protein BDW69DRAFT_195238 [Aspergillus filifer]